MVTFGIVNYIILIIRRNEYITLGPCLTTYYFPRGPNAGGQGAMHCPPVSVKARCLAGEEQRLFDRLCQFLHGCFSMGPWIRIATERTSVVLPIVRMRR